MDAPGGQGDRTVPYPESEKLMSEISEWHASHRADRAQRAGFFERLALFNTATVALTITAVAGTFSGKITHHYSLRAAVCLLLAASTLLIVKTFLLIDYEVKASAMFAKWKFEGKGSEFRYNSRVDRALTASGIACTVGGICLLVYVAWPLL
jgi:hypothetical protein